MSRATNGIEKTVVEGTAAAIEYERDEHGVLTYNGRKVIKKMSELAWMYLQLLVERPRITMKDAAKELDCSLVHLTTIKNSPCFQEEQAKVRGARIAQALENSTMKGLDRVDAIFENEDSDDKVAVRALEVILNAAGGGQQGGGSKVEVNVNAAPASQLGITADMLKEAKERRHRTFDGECEDVQEG